MSYPSDVPLTCEYPCFECPWKDCIKSGYQILRLESIRNEAERKKKGGGKALHASPKKSVVRSNLGARLRAARIAKGLSQEELSIMIGANHSIVSQWERTARPSKKFWDRCVKILPELEGVEWTD